MNRRDFNAYSMASIALAGIAPMVRAGFPLLQPGVQLYTVRELLQLDPAKTFRALRTIGFRHVEWHDVQLLNSLSAEATAAGLQISSCHAMLPFLTGDAEQLLRLGVEDPHFRDPGYLLDSLQAKGIANLVLSYLQPHEREQLDQYRHLIDIMNALGEECRLRGISLCYHNHDFEFQPMAGETPMELMRSGFDKELVGWELDVFWTRYAGYAPEQLVRSLGEQCRMLHLKDIRNGFNGAAPPLPSDFVALGAGILNLDEILRAGAEVGVRNLYIEQDWSNDVLKSLEESYLYASDIYQRLMNS
ncbi:MAG: sugar phosphate isomerase/epimerase [Patiriisocius sp.]|jgi:sugar phosphate isomerase/epimerase